METADFFIPENKKHGCEEEHLSPTGKYKLVVSYYATKPGSWDYSQGDVYAVGSGTPIATIRRNYGSFQFLFIENHPNGHEYLIGGEDYQGQTVVELDTGGVTNNLSRGAEKGHGFCWGSYWFNAQNQILVVYGCYWACPWEYQFFDFSDPMSGWSEIECERGVDGDAKKPVFNEDGTITCFESEYVANDDDSDERSDEEIQLAAPVGVRRTYRRDKSKLVLIEEWMSDNEKESRRKNAEAAKAWLDWLVDFKASDLLYLAYKRLVEDPALTPNSYESHGVTHDGWCPEFKEKETRWCRRIINNTNGYTVDFEWAVKTGPVKLTIFKDGKTFEDKFWMDHSVASIEAAFAYAKKQCQ